MNNPKISRRSFLAAAGIAGAAAALTACEMCIRDSTIPVHDQLHAEMLHEKSTQRPLCAEQKQ